MKVTVIGLGYVGLPLACLLSRKGLITYGVDVSKEKVKLINKKISPIDDKKLEKELKASKIKALSDFTPIKSSDVVVICVPTPVNEKYVPNLEPLKNAVRSVSKYLKKGQIIIVESTIHPGTTEEIVQPILEEKGLKAGNDFYLAHCPERIDPGNKQWDVSNLPRVVGAISKVGVKKAADFYRKVIDADIMELSTVKAAEATKITENTFRDINIAFVNELAKSFDRMGVDVTEVIRGAATKPFAFMPHYPGCGVGGHCIPVDPYYLIERAKENGFEHGFLSLARKINKSMPKFTVGMFTRELNEIEKSVKSAKVCVLGLSYKKNVDDIRESPSFEIMKILKDRGADVKAYDPYVKSDYKTMKDALKNSDYLILATDHDEFVNINLDLLKKHNIKIVVDGKNCLDKAKILSMGIRYKGIGR